VAAAAPQLAAAESMAVVASPSPLPVVSGERAGQAGRRR
jgi:hypothetical protein